MKAQLLMAIAGSLLPGLAYAQTFVDPLLLDDAVWDPSGNPYIIRTRLDIINDSVLTILPGVRIEVGGSIEVSALGTGAAIVARGTPDQPIIFAPREIGPGPWSWTGIRIDENALPLARDTAGRYVQGSIFEHVEVHSANGAIHSEVNLWVQNVAVTEASSTPLHLEIPTGTPSDEPLVVSHFLSRSPRLSTNRAVLDYDGAIELHDIHLEGGGLFADSGSGGEITASSVRDSFSGGMRLVGDWHVSDCDFIDNFTTGEGGGLECITGSFTVDNCRFIGNTAEFRGGGLHLLGAPGSTVRDTLFENNESIFSSGGALRMVDSPGSTITGNRMAHNMGSRVGTLSVNNCPDSVYSDNDVEYNTSFDGPGGALFTGASLDGIVIRDNRFVGNNTLDRGGAIRFDSFGAATLLVENNRFVRNQAADGGGIYVLANGVTLSGNTFDRNMADRGGAIWLDSRSETGVYAGDPATEAYNQYLGNEADVGSSVYNNTSSSFSFAYSCWGTTNAAEIEDTMFDRLDDPSKGIVGFQPIAMACPNPCLADFDGDGLLTIFDFLAFQNAFDDGSPAADLDSDGALTLFDFLAFQNLFQSGCE